MFDRFRPTLKLALASAALGGLIPVSACNKAVEEQASYAPGLPDLPATMPLALGDERPVAYAPPAKALPRAKPIKAARIADPNEYYGYADDAWSYYEALGSAPPDYGFYYDDVEPWAWQAYDGSTMFVEPLDPGYRYYYYRPGDEYPYFVRDPDWGYGYDDGVLAVIYDADGGLVPYGDYYDGPWLDYASRYYDRGYRLYGASRARHPVIAATWYEVQPTYTVAFLDWEDDLWRQPVWWSYHQRTGDRRDRYWREERARREAEAIRYASWADQGFVAAPPPRAIPVTWQGIDWARDTRRFAPAATGFDGDDAARQRAIQRERQRIASFSRPADRQDQIELSALRERVQPRPAIESLRMERMADRQRQIEARQVQLASRDDRSSRRERAVVQQQEQVLARAQQIAFRRDRGAAGRELGQVNYRRDAREQPLNRADRRGQPFRQGDNGEQWLQSLAGSREQRRQNQVEARPEAQSRQREARAQGQWRPEAQQRVRAESDLRRQARSEAQQQQRQARIQARAEDQQRQQAQIQARQQRELQQRPGMDRQRAAQEQARQQRTQSEARMTMRNAQREQARQAVEQQRAAREQASRQEQGRRQQQAQAEAQANMRNAQREQARQAAEQQRAAREQARQAAQQEQGRRQQQAQAEAQANNMRNAQREQARQAAEQQRAAREQARQAAQQEQGRRQQQAQAEAQANNMRNAQREQARQAAEQQRGQRQQQAQAEAQAQQHRTAQADPGPPNNGGGDRQRRGRGQN